MGTNGGRLLGGGPQALHKPAGHSECDSKASHVFPYMYAYLASCMEVLTMEIIHMGLVGKVRP